MQATKRQDSSFQRKAEAVATMTRCSAADNGLPHVGLTLFEKVAVSRTRDLGDPLAPFGQEGRGNGRTASSDPDFSDTMEAEMQSRAALWQCCGVGVRLSRLQLSAYSSLDDQHPSFISAATISSPLSALVSYFGLHHICSV